MNENDDHIPFCNQCYFHGNGCNGELYDTQIDEITGKEVSACMVAIGIHSILLDDERFIARLHDELKRLQTENMGGKYKKKKARKMRKAKVAAEGGGDGQMDMF